MKGKFCYFVAGISFLASIVGAIGGNFAVFFINAVLCIVNIYLGDFMSKTIDKK